VRSDIENVVISRGEALGNAGPNLLKTWTTGTVIGRGGDDVLSAATNVDPGKEGKTRLVGGTGDDQLFGKGRMYGGPGNDSLHPCRGPDHPAYPCQSGQYRGGAGNDVLVDFAPASARLIGGLDDDTVDSRDDPQLCPQGQICAPDQVICGPGRDTVTSDAEDAVAGDCETVTRGSGTSARLQLAPPPGDRATRPLRGSLRSALTGWP